MKHPLIPRGATVGIDSMCFIYQFETHSRYGSLVQSLFASIAGGNIHAVTSVITVTETLAVSNIAQIPDLRALYLTKLTQMPHLSIYPVTLREAESAAVLRNTYKIKLGDAIQIATAVSTRADVFITNDRILTRVKELPILLLDDLLRDKVKSN